MLDRFRDKDAFTLIEIMLVLVVIGIMIATAMPYLANSIRGNRLHFAARSIASAGRYARSMAVLRQHDTSVRFNLDSSSIEVADVGSSSAATISSQTDTNSTEPAGQPANPGDQDIAQPVDNQDAGPVSAKLSRKLDGVTIASVEVDNGDTAQSGECMITYSKSGRCLPYTVRLVDDRGDSEVVKVDALASVTIEKER